MIDTTIDSFSGKYDFLSNFYPCLIEYESIVYPSVEHAYQAAKCVNIEDKQMIAACATPGKAKRAGKQVALVSNWNSIRVDVMRNLVIIKFRDNELRQKLIETYPNLLIEGNIWNDFFWGQCRGKGRNVLGTLLMEIREKFIKEMSESIDI